MKKIFVVRFLQGDTRTFTASTAYVMDGLFTLANVEEEVGEVVVAQFDRAQVAGWWAKEAIA